MDKDFLMFIIPLAIFFGLLLGGMGILVYDTFYLQPIAAEKANNICKAQGYEFYESFDRIGLFSIEPVAIKCKYVDQYRKIDLNQPLVQIVGG